MHTDRNTAHEDLDKRDRLDRFRNATRRELDLLPQELIAENYEEIRRAMAEDERRFIDGESLGHHKDAREGLCIRHLVGRIASQELAKTPLSKRGEALHKELVDSFASVTPDQISDGNSYRFALHDRCTEIIEAHDTLDRLPTLIKQGSYLLAYKLFNGAQSGFEEAVMSLERLHGYLKEDLEDERRREDAGDLYEKLTQINMRLTHGPSMHGAGLYEAVTINVENCRSLFESILLDAQNSRK